jgi:hypothetical protein
MHLLRTSLCTLALLATATIQAADKPACNAHGTTIDFYDTPTDAARQARKDAKLVFLLHVSGNFEDPRFT